MAGRSVSTTFNLDVCCADSGPEGFCWCKSNCLIREDAVNGLVHPVNRGASVHKRAQQHVTADAVGALQPRDSHVALPYPLGWVNSAEPLSLVVIAALRVFRLPVL